jgi:phosphonoacetaldehyde hydrolase
MNNPENANKIRAVVFDWAGTIVDFGSLAPMGAFVQLFANHGVQITIEQARVPMGLPKIDHIRALGLLPEVSKQWQHLFGNQISEPHVHQLLKEFEPMSAKAAFERRDFIPGFQTMLHFLRDQNISIATTTGYTRRIMEPIIAHAKSHGFEPTCIVCCDDIEKSRPDPMGMYYCMQQMQINHAPHCVVKIDDTAPGIAEGLNAGTWTVGVAISGNALGWTHEQWQQADTAQQTQARNQAEEKLRDAGAHEVVDSIADLPDAIARFNQKLIFGNRPF